MANVSRILGSAMLVAGTCIGAGMLGLPISTAAAGFYPSSAAFVFCWAMMTLSAFLMLEVSLWYPKETNLITMAQATLGNKGKAIAWFTYVLFLYALMTAYTTGAVAMLESLFPKMGIDPNWAAWIVVGFFATIVYFGARSVDWFNRILMVGLIASYIALVTKVIPQISHDLLRDGHMKYLWTVGPLLVTSFGFHLLIPSLKNYLDSDIKGLRIAIFFGSLLPLVVYLFWEVLVLGVIPLKGPGGLVAILHAEQTEGKQAIIELTQLLSHILQQPIVTLFAKGFGLCALLTSFIGVALGLFDFFADGFKIRKTTQGKLLLALLTFLPPVLIAIFYPRFMIALRYAGIFAAILLVIFPAVMVWSGRYHLNIKSAYRVWGGKAVVLLTFLFGLAVVLLEGLHHLNLLPTPLAEHHLFE